MPQVIENSAQQNKRLSFKQYVQGSVEERPTSTRDVCQDVLSASPVQPRFRTSPENVRWWTVHHPSNVSLQVGTETVNNGLAHVVHGLSPLKLLELCVCPHQARSAALPLDLKENTMKRTVALIAIALAAVFYTSHAGAQGPIEIEDCRTINLPGSYVLNQNIIARGTCLEVTSPFVTIDLAGFNLLGNGEGIGVSSSGEGTVVWNGTIVGFRTGVSLGTASSTVEGLRVFRNVGDGIFAIGIVRDNIAIENGSRGILSGGGTVSGNIVRDNRSEGIFAGRISIVSGNTATVNDGVGIAVGCPSNVIENTAVENDGGNLELRGEGCRNINNVAP
jgi:hypothetical protein